LKVPSANFETYLQNTTALTYEDGRLLVATPSPFAAEALERQLSSTISRAVAHVAQTPVDIVFQVNDPSAPPRAGDAPPATREAERPADSPGRPSFPAPSLRPHLTFDTFIVGTSNELAHAAAARVAEAPGRVYNPLYIYSDVGLGKTHLAQAIAHKLVACGHKAIYVTSERFTNDYITAIREGRANRFRQHYRSTDVLIIDDIQFIVGKEQTQEGFFHTFNDLHMTGRQIVVTGDEPASQSLLAQRIQSRLEGGLVVDIQPPDYETRYAILRSKAQRDAAEIDPAVIDTLARRPLSNIRELEGCLNRVLAYGQLTGQTMTPEVAAHAIRSLLAERRPPPLSAQAILRAVADYFGTDEETLRGRRRDKRTAHIRRVAMYLLREDGRLTSPQVGQLLGGKDHSTVLYAQKKLEQQLERDPSLRRELAAIRQSPSARVSA